jgi:hypothetical protein
MEITTNREERGLAVRMQADLARIPMRWQTASLNLLPSSICKFVITRGVILCMEHKIRASGNTSKPPARRGIRPHLLEPVTDKLTLSRRV